MNDKKRELYEIVRWPEVQSLMERHGFESNAFLLNDCEKFGCEAYAVHSGWLHMTDTEDKTKTLYAFLVQMPDLILDLDCGEFSVERFGIRFITSYGSEMLLYNIHFSDCHTQFLCNEELLVSDRDGQEYARVVDVLLEKVTSEYARRFLTAEK